MQAINKKESVTFTEECLRGIWEGEDDSYEILEKRNVGGDDQYVFLEVFVRDLDNDKFYCFSVAHTDNNPNDREFFFDTNVKEVKKIKELKEIERWVDIDYEPKQPTNIEATPISKEECLVAKVNDDMSVVDKWMRYKKAEKMIKDELSALSKEAADAVSKNDGFYQSPLGKVTEVKRKNKKPKDSLKFFLEEKGLLEQCKKDDIDIRKVDELIKAGVLSSNDVSDHFEINESFYLRLGK